MLKEAMNGFCMALADSVPGVSGGTVAFIMGFYDRFIGSVHDLAFGNGRKRKEAVLYLTKLGTGWGVGMALAAVLSALFESYIYEVSSLFLGLIAGAIPLVIKEERECLPKIGAGAVFCAAGIVLVAGITWANRGSGGPSMDLGQFSAVLAIRLFFIGMVAISAMFLPGISGSTLLLVFGAYLPVMNAVRSVLTLDLSCLPCLLVFGCGIVAGAVTTVKAIQVCLEKFRPQTVCVILGMMIGSFYAIVMGPTSLDVPREALRLESFHPVWAVIGAALVFGMQRIKESGRDGRKNENR